MIKRFRVFSRAVNARGYTIGITQNVSATSVNNAIDKVKKDSHTAGLTEVRIAHVLQLRNTA
ncbi:hypothetical protein A8535_003704 [Escherichia coli]|uniref:hypothetical protein n=1 Tax=Escherichia coli TaxID=562 RepID=UPI000E20801B|nr:hypothetical protein [Escherichia coli]EFK2996294.1 hypothetical protein [Escherichia coli]EFO4250441.1 hypothetical protein [Escherichia coli]EJC2652705.1 hypothetical protein [Escherichia coli]MCN4890580.1 hypothetical protein [Escherichia coli]MCV1459907.1 hypothetical protein [Escherichia coli]